MSEMSDETKTEIKNYTDKVEALYSPFATKTVDSRRRYNYKSEDIRTPFCRDADRIIHSHAYTRYIDKTQVFYLVKNDHITHRVLHVQMVSKIGRAVGRSLRLNEDLIEAIALGHDIGHTPYGHTGEACLSLICERKGIGPFRHNVQSIRFLDSIEDCDLTLQVMDGILCHDGEGYDSHLVPEPYINYDEFDTRLETVSADGGGYHPMTPEGCVVRFADTISYIGRDIQDAREVGLISEDDSLPRMSVEILGADNSSIIDTLIKDLIECSRHQSDGSIAYSADVAEALDRLKKFNYTHIYENEKLTSEKAKIEKMYGIIFDYYLDELSENNRTSTIFTDFLDAKWICPRYLKSVSDGEMVRDYIAGMTDRYFESRFEAIVLPRKVDGKF